MTQRTYRRLPQHEEAAGVTGESKKERADRIEQISNKLHAFFWVLLASITFFFADIVEVALFDPEVNRFALNLAVTLFMANLCVMMYLLVWLPYVQRVDVPYDIYCPNMIPVATAFSVGSYIMFVISFWPVWGFLSPLIVTIELFGLIFITHFIPFPC